MKKLFCFFALILFGPTLLIGQKSITWYLNRNDSIGGFAASALTKRPEIFGKGNEKFLQFNGINEALLIDGNPLGDADEFTIEVIFRPDSSLNPANKEQRFIHIRNGADDNRRILLELRLYKNPSWALDPFIKSENSRCALLDSNISHPAGIWYHAALVYKKV